jgi:hypothetical protein
MAMVRLIKLLSYRGFGIRATRENPEVTTDDETAATLVGSGYFEYLTPPEPPPEPEVKKTPTRPKRAKR